MGGVDMNRLEQLRKAAVEARALWQWDEVRRIENEIAIEDGSLTRVAAELPPPEGPVAAPDGWGSESVLAPPAEEPASATERSPRRRRG
jgi:hypothetical protein